MIQSLLSISHFDDLAGKNTAIHRIHPAIKLLVTLVYLIAVVSFDRYEISGLVPFVFYPVIVASIAEIPAWPIIKKLLILEPFIIGIGILNPLFDSHSISAAGNNISAGWLTFLSLCIKSGLTFTAALLLLATTGMDRIASAMRLFGIPRLFVLQLLLTYRYISVLSQEVMRTLTAYSLRSSGHKGIRPKVWGSMPGQILMRSIDRAERIYDAMRLRGFDGEYHVKKTKSLGASDIMYFLLWTGFFISARTWNLPEMIGIIFKGLHV
jgi:cobalt/nickel transport system permease protein